MSRGRPRKEAAPEKLEIVEVVEESTPEASEPDEPEELEFVEVEPVIQIVEEKAVVVYPLVTVLNVLVGRKTYNLHRGQKLLVPPGVRDHFKEKGLIG